MTVIESRVAVAEGRYISGVALESVPPGEHEVAITVATTSKHRRSVRDTPVHHEPWDDSVLLRREGTYGDDGR